MSQFPKRYITARCPEYPDLAFKLLANPTGAQFDAIVKGDMSDDAAAAALGTTLVAAYGGGVFEGYGVTLDFSTPESVIALLKDEDLPLDLRYWIRNAPYEIVQWGREQIEKNYGASFTTGS